MRTVLFSAALVALVASSCGGGDGPETSETTTTAVPDVTTTVATTTAAPTTTTTTTEAPPPEPSTLALDDIPGLVVAWGEGTGDPLELAQDIIAFPLAIPTPANTTPLHISVDMFGGDPESPWRWDWTYEVLSSDPMPDIDIHAEESSPGNVALREFYDPIMTDLGWSYSNSTGSDPGDVGGPNSINHVYRSDAETIAANGLTATPKPAFVWADEEQVFGEGVPGYQVDVPLEFEPDVIPVPIIATIIAELPEIEGAQLVDVRLASWNRPDTSFDAEYGLRYFEVTMEWSLPPGAADDTKTLFSTGLGPSAFFAGEESFFDPGFVEPVEPRVFDDDWTQPIVFLDRYEGTVDISGDDAAGATLELDITLEPNRVVLAELPD